MRILITIAVCLCFTLSLAAQESIVIKGIVKDKRTGESLIGAVVSVKGTQIGASTDFEGAFTLKGNFTLPVTLVVSYIGYTTQEIFVSSNDKPVSVSMLENVNQLADVEVRDTRISEKQKQAPLTVETMDAIAVKETPAANFYEGLSHLKGVDLTAASIGFKIINTRGFNSTSPVRSLQLIDGVDNQSPGLNFSLGNFLGAPELDIQKVDLIVGASGAYYGPNAFNGVINMQTKSPFLFPGLTAQVKIGERNLIETSVRWAQVFKNAKGEDKIAYKFNLYYMQAHDWEATNYDATSQSPVGTKNPGGYDAVNRYGDEFTNNIFYSQLSNLTYVGFGYYLRDGYNEKDLVNYNSHNLKMTGAVHYKIDKTNELIYSSSYGTGTTVYQGDNRFSLRNIQFFQNKIELRKEGKYFVRAYATNEDAGDSYDAYSTALILQNSVKSDLDWGKDYQEYLTNTLSTSVANWYNDNKTWLNQIPANERLKFINDYWYSHFLDTIIRDHNAARQRANYEPNTLNNSKPRLDPNTVGFDSALNAIRSRTNREGGSGFFDKSALYHVAGEYKFTFLSLDFTTGGNFRLYAPNSRGTIFLDTATRIYNKEFGAYLGIERKVLADKGKASLTNRIDKNQNFNLLWSPAATMVYTVKNTHVFRVSVSSAIRNPTLTDQYYYLNVGRAILIGNLHGFDSLVTTSSITDAFVTGDRSRLQYFNVDPVKPERVQTVEFGYRGNAMKDKLYFDISYYHSWYEDFIGYKIGVALDWPVGNPIANGGTVYRVATNSKDIVTTQGVSVGINYFFKKYLGFVGNYSWNRLDMRGSTDPIIPAYNTPEHKYNLGINGRDIDTKIGSSVIRHWGYSINYKWQSGFSYTGSPQYTGVVPAYDMVDAQVNKRIPAWKSTIKVGASNLLDNRVYQVYGGPRVGRLAYISILFELDNWR